MWLKKISNTIEESLWSVGDVGILSNFGYFDFSVISVISWEDILQDSNYLKLDENRVKLDNSMGGKKYDKTDNWNIPCLVLDQYSSFGKKDYKVVMPSASNLYATLGDLLRKMSQTLYPHMFLEIMNLNHIVSFLKKYPELRGFNSVSDFVEYDMHEIYGYEVFVVKNRDGKYYWWIPSLDVFSLEELNGKFGHSFNKVELVLESAKKYLEFKFYSE